MHILDFDCSKQRRPTTELQTPVVRAQQIYETCIKRRCNDNAREINVFRVRNINLPSLTYPNYYYTNYDVTIDLYVVFVTFIHLCISCAAVAILSSRDRVPGNEETTPGHLSPEDTHEY